jgi:hypothetical protein
MIWTICPETDLRLITNVSKRKPIPNNKATTTTTAIKSTRSTKSNSSATGAAAAEEEEEEDHGKLESDVIVNKTLFATVRSQVLHHASAMGRAIRFLMHLQETRSSKRTTDIKPKVQFISLYERICSSSSWIYFPSFSSSSSSSLFPVSYQCLTITCTVHS